MERRGDLGVVTKGVFAVLGVSKMREELGEGQGVEEGVQNTWRDGLLLLYDSLSLCQIPHLLHSWFGH